MTTSKLEAQAVLIAAKIAKLPRYFIHEPKKLAPYVVRYEGGDYLKLVDVLGVLNECAKGSND